MSCEEELPLLYGMTNEQLAAQFTALQTAIFNLMSGRREVTVSYAQGDGAKSVTYTNADLAGMQMLLRYIGNKLGYPMRRRRAIGVVFT